MKKVTGIFILENSLSKTYDTSKRNKAVMISEEDFRAMEETLYLLSIPGMRESILKGRKESTDESSDQLDWQG